MGKSQGYSLIHMASGIRQAQAALPRVQLAAMLSCEEQAAFDMDWLCSVAGKMAKQSLWLGLVFAML